MTTLMYDNISVSNIYFNSIDSYRNNTLTFFEGFEVYKLMRNVKAISDASLERSNQSLIGTTILTNEKITVESCPETKHGFFNDNYDLTAKRFVKKTNKIMVKIKSISKFKPNKIVLE